MKKKGTISPVLPKSGLKALEEKKARLISVKTDKPEYSPVSINDGWHILNANVSANIHGTNDFSLAPGYGYLVDCGFYYKKIPGFDIEIKAKSIFAQNGIIITDATSEVGDDGYCRMKVYFFNCGKNIIRVFDKELVGEFALRPVWKFGLEEM